MDVVLDDRLLIEELLVGLDHRGMRLHTTTYWYDRACRAAVVGAGGYLSGPFQGLPEVDQQHTIASMLQLPEHAGVPDSRRVAPLMVDVAERHPRLSLLNLEAVAVARSLLARVWLSPESTAGVLPEVLRAENVSWETVSPG